MQNILSFLMLSAACVGCLGQGSTTHVKWVPSAPGNTCRNQCRAVGSAVNMDMFENDKSGHALCGRIIGKELLLGSTSQDETCRIMDRSMSVKSFPLGSYLCGCDTTFTAASFEWKDIVSCSSNKMTAYAAVCSGEVAKMEERKKGITHYSMGYVTAMGGWSKCVTPDGVLSSFQVLCDYP